MIKYVDKHNQEIKEGMYLKFPDGSIELIQACQDEYGETDLGIQATSDEYLKSHPDTPIELYPLYEFDTTDCEIVED